MIDLARLLYIGVTLLGYTEHEVWKMTPYKIMTLYDIHREYTSERFEAPRLQRDPIDNALGGL